MWKNQALGEQKLALFCTERIPFRKKITIPFSYHRCLNVDMLHYFITLLECTLNANSFIRVDKGTLVDNSDGSDASAIVRYSNRRIQAAVYTIPIVGYSRSADSSSQNCHAKTISAFCLICTTLAIVDWFYYAKRYPEVSAKWLLHWKIYNSKRLQSRLIHRER